MYIVGFNGPPESGKDTLVQMVWEELQARTQQIPFNVRPESLSAPLRYIAYAMVGRVYQPHNAYDYGKFKNTYFSQLKRDGRHLMIDASESFLKPVYGDDVMAQMLLARNEGFNGLLLVCDSGFQCEVKPIIEAVGADNLMVVNVHRPGKSFDNDSREWVVHPNPDRQMRVFNSGTLDDLRQSAPSIVEAMESFGWKF